MEASWRQVAGGRGRARGRATAAPSSGNGVHLRGAGGGREKGSVGAAGPGPSPGGAATAAAAGSSARRSPSGPGAPQPSAANGENGSRPRSHLRAHQGACRAELPPPLLSLTFLLLREFITGPISRTFHAAPLFGILGRFPSHLFHFNFTSYWSLLLLSLVFCLSLFLPTKSLNQKLPVVARGSDLAYNLVWLTQSFVWIGCLRFFCFFLKSDKNLVSNFPCKRSCGFSTFVRGNGRLDWGAEIPFRLGLGTPFRILSPTSGTSCHFASLPDCLILVTLIVYAL